MHSFKPEEIREPQITGARVLSFDDEGDGPLVGRDSEGRLYHSPPCPDFLRYGRCLHLANAQARAETPREAWAAEVATLALRGVEEGRRLRTIAQDIVALAFVQEDRERYLAEHNARQELNEEETLERAKEALQRHAGPCR